MVRWRVLRRLLAMDWRVQRISAINRLRLDTSSLQKMEWRCLFTVSRLKPASSAISWLLRPSHTKRAKFCSRLVRRTRCDNEALLIWYPVAALAWKLSNSTRKCGRAKAAEPICFKLIVARRSRRVGCRTVSSQKLAGARPRGVRCSHRFLRTRHWLRTSGGSGAFNLIKRASDGPRCHTAQDSAAAWFR